MPPHNDLEKKCYIPVKQRACREKHIVEADTYSLQQTRFARPAEKEKKK